MPIWHAMLVTKGSSWPKIDCKDSNIENDSGDVIFIAEFDDVPSPIIIDTAIETSLEGEYLLTKDNTLKIKKKFNCGLKTPKVSVSIIANHPTNSGVENLLGLKETELQKIIKSFNNETAPLKGNPKMRTFIWENTEALQFEEKEIQVDRGDSKEIWSKIENYLPMFALFQSDRASTDSDAEVQNPLKAAIQQAIQSVEKDIQSIQEKVEEKVMQIVTETHDALKSIDENLAKQIKPSFIAPSVAKWSGLFNVSMDTDEGIPLNKRGSGIRRMILVSFFKAEAERQLEKSTKNSIIYAIEEPEAAQHPNNQKILLESFRTISQQENSQIILTSHSPGLVAELPADSIRFVTTNDNGYPDIKSDTTIFGEVAEALGLVPDSRVKVLICVEGPTDIPAIKYLSKALNAVNEEIPNLLVDERFAFISLGGSSLKHWVTENYLRGINLPEIHIYDNDVSIYQSSVDEINSRGGKNWATLTCKQEIESYLHTDAIEQAYPGISLIVDDTIDVPKEFGVKYSLLKNLDNPMGANKSKSYLTRAFQQMTYEKIEERSSADELKKWFSHMMDAVK